MKPAARRHRTHYAAGVFLLALVWAWPQAVVAQSATVLFERAQADEQALGEAASVDAVRRVAKAYEAVVLRHPSNALVDNALWQAAQLMDRAWTGSSEARDRDAAVRYFAWLAREYPSSSMATRAATRAAALKAASAPAAPEPTPQAPPPAANSSTAPPSAPSTSPASHGEVVLRSITRTPLPRGDRITIELSDETVYSGERVTNPDRVFFDFTNSRAAITLGDQLRALQSPLIKTVRVGSPARGVTRVVLELLEAPRYSAFQLYNPYRLLIDVESTAPAPPLPTPQSVATAAPTPTPTPVPIHTLPVAATAPPSTPTPIPTAAPKPPVTSSNAAKSTARSTPASEPSSPVAATSTGRGDYSLARQLGLRVAKIVIDPGHGGHDPGALANGVTESELVLDIALRLEALLEETPGVEVVLTRRTNEFVPLEERTAIANRERADLFLSIHANSHRQAAVRGIETYFLNFATNPEAEAVAARENAASFQTMGTLPSIVKAIALNNKLEESREFAALLQSALMKQMRPQSSAIRDLGVKQAPFVVLIGADMPSVLTEVAFLTNRAEAGLLKQPAHRQLIAKALRDAVLKYQGSLKRVSTAQAPARRE